MEIEKLIRLLRDVTCGDCENVEECEEKCVCLLFGTAADLLETQQKRITELEARIKWIPVTERLPEQPGVFLVFTKSGNQSVQWFHILDGYHLLDSHNGTLRYFGDVSQHEKITHWMPLPEPPKEVPNEAL